MITTLIALCVYLFVAFLSNDHLCSVCKNGTFLHGSKKRDRQPDNGTVPFKTGLLATLNIPYSCRKSTFDTVNCLLSVIESVDNCRPTWPLPLLKSTKSSDTKKYRYFIVMSTFLSIPMLSYSMLCILYFYSVNTF